MMKIAYIQHVPYEDLGVIGEWATERGHDLVAFKPFLGDALPHLDEFECLIILGGPQSARHVFQIDYLQKEVELIKKAIASGKYVLGICLGAQLIGVAQGAHSVKSPEPEMGCYAVSLTPAAKQDRIFKHFPDAFDSLHWHFDMIGLPEGATVLAKSAACPVQAVCFSEKVYGLQCHLEFNKPHTEKLIEKTHHSLPKTPFVQPREEILTADFDAINQKMKLFLDLYLSL